MYGITTVIFFLSYITAASSRLLIINHAFVRMLVGVIVPLIFTVFAIIQNFITYYGCCPRRIIFLARNIENIEVMVILSSFVHDSAQEHIVVTYLITNIMHLITNMVMHLITNISLFLTIFRIIVTFTVILFLLPQINIAYYDYVLNTVNSTGIFLNYPNAKNFVIKFTWFCIFSYVLVTFVLYF